ncbi:sulfur carrier protein ThiS [Massilia yuzhufengensis]|uniref:Sulfur carrier protein ThiS n=1 Tax=Massilia yuzhufengensis TaxID=1164594 RepID=A0A1I1L4T4_9BURK|nr:sulfur carrier protein ThiS [Massilia yuzhufengensis]SFC64610.1 sulfur carrier protein ThiS [Massilia yuzhufengensis]
MTEIELNGAPYCVPQAYSLQELAGRLGVAEQAVAVAVNREVVPRPQWPQRQLQARDRVDIVRAIGGG